MALQQPQELFDRTHHYITEQEKETITNEQQDLIYDAHFMVILSGILAGIVTILYVLILVRNIVSFQNTKYLNSILILLIISQAVYPVAYYFYLVAISATLNFSPRFNDMFKVTVTESANI